MKQNLVLFLTLLLLCSTAEARRKVGHVVLIGLDGWGAYSVPKAHDIPNLQWLISHGSCTLKKRSVFKTESAINWASMFNGAPTEMHGYTNWNSRVPEVPSAALSEDGIYPTIFYLLRKQRPSSEIGVAAEWDGIKYLVDTLALNYNGLASNYERDPEQLTRMAEQYIKQKKPTLFAVCYDQIDHTGHADGHDTPAYYATLARIDIQIGRIMKALKESGIWDDTVIIVTADHGGVGKSHGGMTLLETETPFIVYGKGIKEGFTITDTVIQYDTAATIAELLGLKRPQCWRGLPIYSIFK